MKIYENGDRCPCCGQALNGKEKDWLELFSQLCSSLGLEELPPKLEIQDMDTGALDPPPDAGIYPPVTPRPVMGVGGTAERRW